MSKKLPKLYSELADWWLLISPTEDYAEESKFFRSLFEKYNVKTILELGAGGGNVAWHLKKHFDMTLTDISPDMLRQSQKQNPQLEHKIGDMRTLRLNKTFDGVLIHDAVMYMQTKQDLLAAFQTAAAHLKLGGTLVVAPDCTLENFKESTNLESHDQGKRSVRYLEWVSDPDPTDTVFDYDFILALKNGDELSTIVDRQHCGVFPRQTWLDLLKRAGFEAKAIQDRSTAGEAHERIEVFVGVKN